MSRNDGVVVKSPMFKDERSTLERVEKFISKHHFLDCNLRGRLYHDVKDCHVAIRHVDFGMARSTFVDAVDVLQNRGALVERNFSFGPTWTTHWFQIGLSLPKAPLATLSTVVPVFRWKSGCEAMVWNSEGKPLLGLNSTFDRTDVRLSNCERMTESEVTLYVECACNEMFGAGSGGQIAPPDNDRYFRIEMADVCWLRLDIYDLLMDMEVLYEFARRLPTDSERRYDALYTANHLINQLVRSEVDGNFSPDTVMETHATASAFFHQPNAPDQHTIHAVGNCHIDTAWLWPYAETRRKCARSWATTLDLMDSYPELNFAVSQAQQLVWLKQDYPSLYERISERGHQGRFVGVGGCWVEMDGNIPSGESLCRQILYGQQVFMETFGRYCSEYWLPDTFGYASQLPQLVLLGGMCRFVTQKLSWNFVNTFPHHSFFWRGLDGSRLLTHFPPADTYCSEVTVEECLKACTSNRDKGRVHSSLLLYGHGDGGGGPNREMLERLRRLRDVSGCPKVEPSTPQKFFEQLEACTGNLCTWSGELYLELHNGTYTTAAKMKRLNRFYERKLTECDLIAAWIWLDSKGEKAFRFTDEWKKVLLNQFHDVLPGSSIAQVYIDAFALYAEVDDSIGKFWTDLKASVGEPTYVVNQLGWTRPIIQKRHTNISKVEAFTVTPRTELVDVTQNYIPVKITSLPTNGEIIFVENGYFRAEFNQYGHLLLLKALQQDGKCTQNLAAADCNQFLLHHDVPLYWDAWDCMDYHLETPIPLTDVYECLHVVEESETCVQMRVSLTISSHSRLNQNIFIFRHLPFIVFDTEVEWNETHRFLKVQFPCNINADHATYETQFGHLKRPNHRNTLWDAAKYEVCAHRWATLCEYDAGVALLNDGKYGHSCHNNILTLSLLRAPTAPDPHADIGTHRFSYGVMPFAGTFQNPKNHPSMSVLQAAAELNEATKRPDDRPCFHSDVDTSNFLRSLDSHQLVEISGDVNGVLLDTVKISECGTGLVLRFYESFGGKASPVQVALSKERPLNLASICDILERPTKELTIDKARNSFILDFEPFKVVSVLLTFSF